MTAHWTPLRCLHCNCEFLSLRDHTHPLSQVLHAHCPACQQLADCIVRDPTIPFVAPAQPARNHQLASNWLETAYAAPSCTFRNS